MWVSTYQSLFLYSLLLPYRLGVAIHSEMLSVRQMLVPPGSKLRTPLLSLHVNTLPLTLGSEKKKGKDYLKTVYTES